MPWRLPAAVLPVSWQLISHDGDGPHTFTKNSDRYRTARTFLAWNYELIRAISGGQFPQLLHFCALRPRPLLRYYSTTQPGRSYGTHCRTTHADAGGEVELGDFTTVLLKYLRFVARRIVVIGPGLPALRQLYHCNPPNCAMLCGR